MRILAALALAPFVVGVAAQPPVPKPDAAPAAAKTQDEFCQAPKSLRTAVREKGVRIERGNDPKRGAWLRDRDGVTALQGPTHQQEIDKVRSEVRLFRQVLRFLDPARLIGETTDWAPLRTDDLASMRLRYPRCRVVEGTLQRFPTYHAGSDGRARMTICVHGQSHQLVAVMAILLDAGGKPADLGEFIHLQDHKATKDVLLPGKLTVAPVRGPGRVLPFVTVSIVDIDLALAFAADHFARPN